MGESLTERTDMGEQDVPHVGGWWSRHTSLATRLAIAMLVVSLIPVVASVALTSITATDSGREVARQRLKAVEGARAAELGGYFVAVESTVRMLSASPMIIDGAKRFSEASAELEAIDVDSLTEERDGLTDYYVDDFAPALAEVRGEPVDVLELAPREDASTLYLQSVYIADNPFEPAEKRLLTDGEDGSAWTEVHKDLHPTLRSTVDRLDLEDLLIVDSDTRQVLYSTNKDPVFATDLDGGPYSGTLLAQLVEEVIATREPGHLAAADFSVFTPALDAPTAFVAGPLFDGDELIGVVVAALSTGDINEIMSRDWKDGRRGETGDLYLVGPDLRMRSDSRSFVESPTEYLETMATLDTQSEADLSRMSSLGTTVLFQTVDTDAVRDALDGESGSLSETNYRGHEVYSSYQPVDSELFGWVLIYDQDVAEVDEPFIAFVRDSLVVTAIFVVLITFVSVAWANLFVSPLQMMSAALVRIREGDEDVTVPARGSLEFRQMAGALDHMVSELRARRRDVTVALEAKVDVLRTLLPPAAAERVGRGDRKLVDTVPQASAVVLVLEGLDDVFRDRDAGGNRDFVHALVDEVDSLATINGLERVKLSGDVYYAVCGVSSPHVDHASRAVTFSFQVRSLVNRMAREQGVELTVSAGINSGSITTGLVGGSRLVYDLWGDTVDEAYMLARAAGTEEIAVTAATRDRIPASRVTEPVDLLPGVETWIVRPESAPREEA